jgi:quinol monooxygenase YgiN
MMKDTKVTRVTEFADFQIVEGKESAFEAAVTKAVEVFKSAEGCIAMRLDRIVERPNFYRLIVEWETLEHHTVTFRNSDGFQRWRSWVGEFFAATPTVEHCTNAVTGFAREP